MVDSHCHLADAVFVDDLPEVVERARAAGITSAVCILAADDEEEAGRVGAVRTVWPAVGFAAGIHPHRAGAWGGRLADARRTVEKAVETHEACAVGEIGLDYHYNLAPRDQQRDVFAMQLDVARARNRPVVIHTREAMDDTVDVIRGAGATIRGVLHCFTGSLDDARRALDLGFYISMSGIVTFPKSSALREVAAYVPVDRLLVETDAPYLAPVPHRGRRNEPAWTSHTLGVVAGLRGMTPEDLDAVTTANTQALFPALAAGSAR
jgi:TatD DNase family protein